MSGWFFFLAEIALRRLLYRILQHRYRDGERQQQHPQSDVTELMHSIAEFDLQLEQWYVQQGQLVLKQPCVSSINHTLSLLLVHILDVRRTEA